MVICQNEKTIFHGHGRKSTVFGNKSISRMKKNYVFRRSTCRDMLFYPHCKIFTTKITRSTRNIITTL